MIEAKGIVVSVEGAQAEVRLDETGCGRCHEEGGCGGHNLGAMLNVGNFIRAVRTRNLYSATSVDQLPHMVASHAQVDVLLGNPEERQDKVFIIFIQRRKH